MAKNLTNAELISQIAKNNPVWTEEKSRELLRLNRKFTYYRNINNLMQIIYRQNKIHTLNSDDYAVEISNKFNQSLSRKALDISNEQDEADYYKLVDLITELGTGESVRTGEEWGDEWFGVYIEIKRGNEEEKLIRTFFVIFLRKIQT